MARAMRTQRTAKSVKEPKATLVAEEQVEIDSTVKEPVKVEKKESIKVSEKKFDQDNYVLCKSVNVGKTYFIGPRTQNTYEWLYKGDEVEVLYKDLAAGVRQNPTFFTKPFVTVEDEDFVNEFPKLREVYKNLYSIGDIEDILKMPAGQIARTLKTLPIGIQDAVKSLAMTKIADHSLDSVRVITALDDYFGTKMMLATGLFDDVAEE